MLRNERPNLRGAKQRKKLRFTTALGIPRILRAYGEDCFKFTDNFIRITLPISEQDGTQSAPSQHPVLKTLIN